MKKLFLQMIKERYFILGKIILNILNNKKYLIEENNEYFINFTKLKSFNLNENNNLIIKEKKNILQLISKDLEKEIYFVNNIFFMSNCRFGNCLVLLNKYIHYCEIIGCKTIILDE